MGHPAEERNQRYPNSERRMRSKSKPRTRKSCAANYTTPEFLEELESKTGSYYFDAPQFKCPLDGKRRSTFIVKDPIFLAIKELRGCLEQLIRLADARPKSDYSKADDETKQASELLESTICNFRSELAEPLNPEFERKVVHFIVGAIKQGNITAVEDFLDKCSLLETKNNPPRERRSDSKPWRYYAGRAALHYLKEGIVPTKGQVKERSLLECAQSEFLMDSRISQWPKRIGDKANQMRHLLPGKRNWSRIFSDLGLSGLPASPTH